MVPVDKETVRAGWEDIAALVEGGLGIHCCSNTDWEFVLGLNPSVVSIDAYATAKEFLLYADSIVAYMEQGGVVAWGIVPAEYKIFATENSRHPLSKVSCYQDPVSAHACRNTFLMHSLSSHPAAGYGLLTGMVPLPS